MLMGPSAAPCPCAVCHSRGRACMWVRVALLLKVCPTSAVQPMRKGYLLAMLLQGTCHENRTDHMKVTNHRRNCGQCIWQLPTEPVVRCTSKL